MPTEHPNPALEADNAHDWDILQRLLQREEHQPWHIEEIIHSHEDHNISQQETQDAITRLYGAGLIHITIDGLVTPTRAALHFKQITS